MKGEETRATILQSALKVARLEGLDSLSIGRLAKNVGLSKSGLFAHFNSKEALQLQVLEHGVAEFVERVVKPAIKEPRGEPRLRALFDRWRKWAAGNGKGGCLFLGAAIEYDDRPGPIREFMVHSQHLWTQTLSKAVLIAQQEGHTRADINPDQLAFELYSIMMAYHLYHRLLRDPLASARAESAFEQLLANSK